jgi:uncharacterized membrane protein YidH (DUF202 family)
VVAHWILGTRVSLAIGALLPALTTLSTWPLVLLGSGFGLLGVWLIIYGHYRHVAMDRALDRGEYLSLGSRHTEALVVTGTVLGISIVALVLYAALQ